MDLQEPEAKSRRILPWPQHINVDDKGLCMHKADLDGNNPGVVWTPFDLAVDYKDFRRAYPVRKSASKLVAALRANPANTKLFSLHMTMT